LRHRLRARFAEKGLHRSAADIKGVLLICLPMDDVFGFSWRHAVSDAAIKIVAVAFLLSRSPRT